MDTSEAAPHGPVEPEFTLLLAPLLYFELAEEGALAMAAAWGEAASATVELWRSQAAFLSESLARMSALGLEAQARREPADAP